MFEKYYEVYTNSLPAHSVKVLQTSLVDAPVIN